MKKVYLYNVGKYLRNNVFKNTVVWMWCKTEVDRSFVPSSVTQIIFVTIHSCESNKTNIFKYIKLNENKYISQFQFNSYFFAQFFEDRLNVK